MQNLIYSWSNFQKDLDKIYKKLKRVKYNKILAIYRGGLIPGVCLSHLLNTPLAIIQLQLRDSGSKEIQLFHDIPEDSKILIIDDIIDSGKTLNKIIDFFKHNKIQYDVVSLFCYDYYPEPLKFQISYCPNTLQREDPRWVVFPWEQLKKKRRTKMFDNSCTFLPKSSLFLADFLEIIKQKDYDLYCSIVKRINTDEFLLWLLDRIINKSNGSIREKLEIFKQELELRKRILSESKKEQECDYREYKKKLYNASTREEFKELWDPDKFNWEKDTGDLISNCSEFVDIWYDPNRIPDSYRAMMIEHCRDKFDVWYDSKRYPLRVFPFSGYFAEFCSKHIEKWWSPEEFDWNELDLLFENCLDNIDLWWNIPCIVEHYQDEDTEVKREIRRYITKNLELIVRVTLKKYQDDATDKLRLLCDTFDINFSSVKYLIDKYSKNSDNFNDIKEYVVVKLDKDSIQISLDLKKLLGEYYDHSKISADST